MAIKDTYTLSIIFAPIVSCVKENTESKVYLSCTKEHENCQRFSWASQGIRGIARVEEDL